MDARSTLEDTIVASATAAGRGGIAILRLSGAKVPEAARALLGSLPPAREAIVARFLDGGGVALDEGVALYFAAPHSYTGEPVLELHGHGSPVLQEALIARCLELGARRARAGEFTLRAFLNGRLDLAQAEAVADLIAAGTGVAARAALRSLEGEFSRRVEAIAGELAELRTRVEADIDFAQEAGEVGPGLRTRLTQLREHCAELSAGARQGRLLADGLVVALAGRPNAGKSSLLNRLAGHEAAIVADLPGTTRDVLRERIDLEGLPVELIDTAGLREAEGVVEQEGVRRARAAIARADHVLYLVDSSDDEARREAGNESAALGLSVPVTLLYTKIDLGPVAIPQGSLAVSAREGTGLDALRVHLARSAGYAGPHGGTASARARHVDALGRCALKLRAAEEALREARYLELAAEELRLAQADLAEITGEVTSEELLGRIFSAFCIGK
jgi:tRNA modification GTPase